MGHIDDSLLIGQTFYSCQRNVFDTVSLFIKLGFTVHPVKSVLKPLQKIESACENLLLQKTVAIRTVGQVIGFLVSSFPAVEFAEMHYRHALQACTQCQQGEF